MATTKQRETARSNLSKGRASTSTRSPKQRAAARRNLAKARAVRSQQARSKR